MLVGVRPDGGFREVLHLYVTDRRLRPHRVPGWQLSDDGGSEDETPAWSPDGRRVSVPSEHGIALVDVRTGAERMLVRGAAGGPRFAPDGRSVVFDGPGGIWRMDLGSRAMRRVVDDGYEPAWSPDSRQLAFTTTRDHYGSYAVHEAPDETANEIHTIAADGSGERRVTRTKRDERSPAWASQSRLVFDRGVVFDGTPALGSIAAAGGCISPVPGLRLNDYGATGVAWRPGSVPSFPVRRCAS